MANLRPILFMGLLVLAYMMWMQWQKEEVLYWANDKLEDAKQLIELDLGKDLKHNLERWK